MQREIFSATDEELRNIAINKPQDSEVIRRILLDGIREIRYEIERLERFTESFAVRGGALMTVAGLISLLPYTITENGLVFLKHYLIWTFPFLFIAILAFIKSSRRAYSYRIQFTSVAPGAPEEIVMLRAEAMATQEIWKMAKESHTGSMRWHRLVSINTILFLFSYIFSFYSFVFYVLPNFYIMFIFSMWLLVLGMMIYRKNILESGERNISENSTRF